MSRPRKYTTDADRQRAYRERYNVTLRNAVSVPKNASLQGCHWVYANAKRDAVIAFEAGDEKAFFEQLAIMEQKRDEILVVLNREIDLVRQGKRY